MFHYNPLFAGGVVFRLEKPAAVVFDGLDDTKSDGSLFLQGAAVLVGTVVGQKEFTVKDVAGVISGWEFEGSFEGWWNGQD